jgi:uncharacterized membrane protein YcaP (DUF421 family)
MNHDQLFALGVPPADKVVRTVVVYVGIALALRLAGKRDLAQLNSFDLVVTLLLANVVQNAIIGPDNSLIGGLLGVAILLTINSGVVRFVSRHEWAVRMFEGSNTTLVKDGRYIESALRREGLRKADIEVALRQQNANGLEEVAEATLTPGGAIIVCSSRRPWPPDAMTSMCCANGSTSWSGDCRTNSTLFSPTGVRDPRTGKN